MPLSRGSLLAALAALLPLTFLAGFSVNAALDAYRAAEELRLRDTARALASAVDAELGSYVAGLTAFSSSSRLEGALVPQSLERRARALAADFDANLLLIGPPPDHTTLLNTINPTNAAQPPRRSPEMAAIIAAPLARVFGAGLPAVSDLFPGAQNGRPSLAVFRPVSADGQVRYALGFGFRPIALQAILARQDLPHGTFAAIADGNLRTLAQSLDPAGQNIGRQAPAWLARSIEGRERALLVGPDWHGQDHVYAIERLTRAPNWTVLVAQPVAAMRDAAWRGLRWLPLSGGAIALGLAIMVWASRREALRDARREAAALLAGRAEVERLHGGLPAIIFLREIGPDGTVRLRYRGGDVEAVTGWPADAIARLSSITALAETPTVPLDKLLAREGKESGSFEWRIRRPDGSCGIIRTMGRVLERRPDGTQVVVGYALDVTAERAAEARAITSARLASLGEMAAGMAHEIRQPLTVISLVAQNAQTALAAGETTSVDEALERIITQTERTGDLIEHLRLFSRGVAEDAPLEVVPLATVMDSVRELVAGALQGGGIVLEQALGEPPLVVLGHRLGLEQVMVNLLLNARDAMAGLPRGAMRRITIAAKAAAVPGRVELTVADSGTGIPPAVLARLFQPFVTTKDPDRGTGLGLATCYGLLKSMGGTINGNNAASGGAVFTITLPAAPAA